MNATAVPADSNARPNALRVFYAIWPDALARERIAQIAAEIARMGGGRAIAACNLHVTLAFIGAVPTHRLDALRDAGAVATRGIDAIDVSLERLGGAHNGELAWLAPTSVPPALVELHAKLDAALEARGFATERREFRPHVTLARRCARRVHHAPIDPIAWRVSALTLMASTTGREGSEYRELGGWPLEGS